MTFLVLIPTVMCLLISEVNFSHGHPFVELAKETTDDDDMAVPNGHYGVLILEFLVDWRKWEKSASLPRFKVRAGFDLSGTDFSQNYKVIGNAPSLQEWQGKMKYHINVGDNWLKPPKKSFTVVILTYNPIKPLLDHENWEGTQIGERNSWTGLTGNLRQYVTESSHDMVAIGDKDSATDLDKMKLYSEFIALFSFEDTSWYLKSTENEVEPKSHNKCDPYERFTMTGFKIGSPTPNDRNDCPSNNPVENAGEPMDAQEMDCESADDFPSVQIGKDRLAALKESVSKLDKEWKTSRNKDWEYIAHLVKTHQSDKLSWKHFLKPEIQDWIEYLIDPNDLTKSRTR